MLFFILCATLLLILIWSIKSLRYWNNIGVSQSSILVPLFGDSWSQFLGLHSIAEWVQFHYNKHIGTRYHGCYQFHEPVLMVTDPDLIRQICIKDFEYFQNHPNSIPEHVDPMWNKNLLILKGQEWKDMRGILSPSFTTSKMKQLFVLIEENAKTFVNFFMKKDEKSIVVETKDLFTRFANDVIANSVFGVNCNSLENPNDEFYLNGSGATNFTGFWKSVKVWLIFTSPLAAKLLQLPMFSKKVTEFFTNIVKESISYREKNNIVRPDLINLLLQARKDFENYSKDDDKDKENTQILTEQEYFKIDRSQPKKCNLTDEDITAQGMIFFFAGFDQNAIMLSWIVYELALNPDIQQKLIKEIDNIASSNKKLSYEILSNMTYLDMVVSETFRKWPVTIITDRLCTKDYLIRSKVKGEKDVLIKKDTMVWIPFYAIQRDPKYFENPEKFDPERFSAENRHKIVPYSYIPFGVGPRICIGSRFTLMEIKVLIYYLLLNFTIEPTEKTDIPITLIKTGIALQAKNGYWLKFVKRSNK